MLQLMKIRLAKIAIFDEAKYFGHYGHSSSL